MVSPGAVSKVIEIVIKARNETGTGSAGAATQIKTIRTALMGIGAATIVVGGAVRALVAIQETARAAAFEVLEFNRRVAAGEQVITRSTERVRALAASMDPKLVAAYKKAKTESDTVTLAIDKYMVRATGASSITDFLKKSFLAAALGPRKFAEAMEAARKAVEDVRLETERYERSRAMNEKLNAAIARQRETDAKKAEDQKRMMEMISRGYALGDPLDRRRGMGFQHRPAGGGFESSPILDLFPVDEVRARVDEMAEIMRGFADGIGDRFGMAIDSMGEALGRAVVFHESFTQSAKLIWKGFIASVLAQIMKMIAALAVAAILTSFIPGMGGGFSTAGFKDIFKALTGGGGPGLGAIFGIGGGSSERIARMPSRRSGTMDVNVNVQTLVPMSRAQTVALGRFIAGALQVAG